MVAQILTDVGLNRLTETGLFTKMYTIESNDNNSFCETFNFVAYRNDN